MNYLEFFSGKTCLSFSIYLFISIWTPAYLFHTLDYTPVLYLFCFSNASSLDIGGSFIWILCPFHTLLSLYRFMFAFLFVCFSTSLLSALQRLIFISPPLVPDSAISSRSPSSLYEK